MRKMGKLYRYCYCYSTVYSYAVYIDAKDGETVQVLLLLLYSIQLCSVQGWGNCAGTVIVIVHGIQLR